MQRILYNFKKDLNIMRKFKSFCVFLCLIFSISIFPSHCLAAKTTIKPDSLLTNNFVANATATRTTDENGSPIILLEKTTELFSLKKNSKNNAKISVAIIPENNVNASEIMNSIYSLASGSGTHTEDEWFYASSVHVTSTIYYSSTSISSFTYAAITKVTITVHTNNGTTISAMKLIMGQIGLDENGQMRTAQRKEFNALTARTFYPPASWVPINLSAGVSAPLAAHLNFTTKRQAGTKNFSLYNYVGA